MDQKSVIFFPNGIFFDENFKCEPYLCNGCHDLIQKAMGFGDVAIISVKESDYKFFVYEQKWCNKDNEKF